MIYKFCPKCGTEYQDQPDIYKLNCQACEFTFYLNSKPTACVIIAKDDKILLGKRAIDPFKGKWDIVGGFLNFGEHPEQGAIRETKEETGLDIKITGTLGFYMDSYGTDEISTLNIAFTAEPVTHDQKAGDDIEELRWFDVNQLPPDIAFKNGRDILDAWIKIRNNR